MHGLILLALFAAPLPDSCPPPGFGDRDVRTGVAHADWRALYASSRHGRAVPATEAAAAAALCDGAVTCGVERVASLLWRDERPVIVIRETHGLRVFELESVTLNYDLGYLRTAAGGRLVAFVRQATMTERDDETGGLASLFYQYEAAVFSTDPPAQLGFWSGSNGASDPCTSWRDVRVDGDDIDIPDCREHAGPTTYSMRRLLRCVGATPNREPTHAVPKAAQEAIALGRKHTQANDFEAGDSGVQRCHRPGSARASRLVWSRLRPLASVSRRARGVNPD